MGADELLISCFLISPQVLRHEEWLKRLSFLLSHIGIYVLVSAVKFCYCLCLLVRHKRESDRCQNVDADLMPHFSVSIMYSMYKICGWTAPLSFFFCCCCFCNIAYSGHQSEGLIRCKSSGPSHLQQYCICCLHNFFMYLWQNITIIQPLWIIYDRLAITISRPWGMIVYKGFKFVISHQTSLWTYPFMPLVP